MAKKTPPIKAKTKKPASKASKKRPQKHTNKTIHKTKHKTKLQKLKTLASSHKLVVVLLIILAAYAYEPIQNTYRDWDNAQFIKGITRDFPLVVEEINSATGLELEQKVNCFATQEKFNVGKKTCEFSIVAGGDSLQEATRIVETTQYFGEIKILSNAKGSDIKYRNKNSCGMRTVDYFSLSCIFAVRDANVDLLRNLLENE